MIVKIVGIVLLFLLNSLNSKELDHQAERDVVNELKSVLVKENVDISKINKLIDSIDWKTVPILDSALFYKELKKYDMIESKQNILFSHKELSEIFKRCSKHVRKIIDEDKINSLKLKKDNTLHLDARNVKIFPYLIFLHDLNRLVIDFSKNSNEVEAIFDSINSLRNLQSISFVNLDLKDLSIRLDNLKKMNFFGFYGCQNLSLSIVNSMNITNLVLDDTTLFIEKQHITAAKISDIELRGLSVKYDKYVSEHFPNADIHYRKEKDQRKRLIKKRLREK